MRSTPSGITRSTLPDPSHLGDAVLHDHVGTTAAAEDPLQHTKDLL
jgi:hypothetical protein